MSLYVPSGSCPNVLHSFFRAWLSSSSDSGIEKGLTPGGTFPLWICWTYCARLWYLLLVRISLLVRFGRTPFHVLVWKASGKGSKSWNGKGTGKGKKSGQEKGKTQPQTSKGKIKGKNSGKGKHARSRPSQETGKDKGNSKKGFTSGESSDDWKSARWDSTSHTNARDTYVVSSTLWLQLECPVCTDVTNGIALKRQSILGFPRRGRCASWIHVKFRVYRGPSFGWFERTTPNTVSEAENYQIWAVLPKPVPTLRISWDGGYFLTRMSQKGWGSRTWWTSLLCLATHCKIRMWNKSFDFPKI